MDTESRTLMLKQLWQETRKPKPDRARITQLRQALRSGGVLSLPFSISRKKIIVGEPYREWS